MDKWLLGRGMATSRNENILGFLDRIPEEDRLKVIDEAERILATRASGGTNSSDK